MWAFAANIEVPDPLPLAFFPEPCPYREAALRALASTPRQWHIACTSSSLAGVRAIAMAGIAVTPLPEVDYVMEIRREDTRQVVKAFADCCQQSVSSEGASYKASGGLRASKSRRRN